MHKNKTTDTNIYELYLNEIRKYGTINNDQIREYLIRYKNGTEEECKVIKERLVGSLQRLVLAIAKKYVRAGNIMDLIGEGNIGLLSAIENYNINSESKFTTYATYWVRREIIRYLTLKEPIVIPPNAVKLATYLPKTRQELWSKNCRAPMVEEIQDALNEKYNLNIQYKSDLYPYQPTSIDEHYESDADGQEYLKDTQYNTATKSCNIDEMDEKNDKDIVINQVLSGVNERDAYIIRSVYGIGCEPKTIECVANEIGIGYERVRQITTNSVPKLGRKFSYLRGAY